ncbi:MAG: hypothetical protein Kow0037_03150 [Calditrichia bacterium]
MNNYIKFFLFVIAGGLAGYAYYYFIGCRTGTCPITSNPWNSTLYGVVMGSVLGWNSNLLKKTTQKETKEEIND